MELLFELSTEAKRLKEILDEQSAFAIEQIELAIQALERDLEHYDTSLSQPHEEPLRLESFTLEEKQEFYNQMQKGAAASQHLGCTGQWVAQKRLLKRKCASALRISSSKGFLFVETGFPQT